MHTLLGATVVYGVWCVLRCCMLRPALLYAAAGLQAMAAGLPHTGYLVWSKTFSLVLG
jgi:hypothetical protein